MDKTQIKDVIVPEIFTEYVIAESLEQNAFIASGIMVPNADLATFLRGGGYTTNIPRWDMISGDDELLTDNGRLTPGKNKASKQVAVRLLRGKAWSTNELAGVLAGSDPMKAIVKQVATFWKTRNQATLLATLAGVFAGPLKDTHVKTITTTINATATLDTKQLLGDAAGQIIGVAMHSATKTELQKQNLIESIPNARGEIAFEAYLGYYIIEDDACPVTEEGVYSTYFFTAGALGYANEIPVGFTATETDRDSLGGDDFLINRQCLAIHPGGLSWVGQSASETPSNVELATAANWELSYEDPKEIGLLCLNHKLSV